MHELRVGAVVRRAARELVGQQPAAAQSAAESASGKETPWKSWIARAALLARRRPGDGLVEQAPHRADAARGDVDALLDEPEVLLLVAAADMVGPPRTASAGHHAVEAHRRVAVRVVVRERRVVDDLDAGRVAVDQEQRRQARRSPSTTLTITM